MRHGEPVQKANLLVNTWLSLFLNFILSFIQSLQRQSNWRHGSAVRGYSVEELRAIWNYVRFAAAKK